MPRPSLCSPLLFFNTYHEFIQLLFHLEILDFNLHDIFSSIADFLKEHLFVLVNLKLSAFHSRSPYFL